jgi:hypothetical protein
LPAHAKNAALAVAVDMAIEITEDREAVVVEIVIARAVEACGVIKPVALNYPHEI